jgi:hypothetical protein
MRDPERLLKHGASEAELLLLRAGAAEEPSAAAQQQLLASLGLSSLLASSAAAQSTAAPASTAAAGGTGALKMVMAKLGVKGLVLALGSAGLAGSVWVASSQMVGTGTLPPDRARSISAPAAPAAHVDQSPDALLPARSLDATSIAREVAELDRVRRQVQRGEPRRALLALDAYADEHPAGALRQEASVLRIDAHWQAGDVELARRHSRAFLRDYPASPHAERVGARLSRPALDAR